MSDHPLMDDAKRDLELATQQPADDQKVAEYMLDRMVLLNPDRRVAALKGIEEKLREQPEETTLRQRAQMLGLRRRLHDLHGRMVRAGR